MARNRFVAWDKVGNYGSEGVDVALSSDRLSARGVAIGWEPTAYALEFQLETGSQWITTRLRVECRGQGWRRRLELLRSAGGIWSIQAGAEGDVDLPVPGGDATALATALDCDLALSPLTNTMPALRHRLLWTDGMHDFVMAWVSVPDLGVHPSAQRYTTRGENARGQRIIEYRSIEGGFAANLTFDPDGLVVDYPQLARRVGARG